MDRTLLIGFTTSYSISLLMTISLLYADIRRPRLQAATYLEKVLAIVFGFGQVAIIMAAIISVVVAFMTKIQAYWLEPLFLSTLQADVAINVCYLIQHIPPNSPLPVHSESTLH